MSQLIQIDMFEVQLGAALMMQFRVEDQDGRERIVRVIADAGDYRPNGKNPIDVLNRKLRDAGGGPSDVWTSFSSAPPRIELIIGTHYDADHLAGLVPIIDHHAWTIDEIWLPPVRSDDNADGGDGSLVRQLLAASNGEVLAQYLNVRRSRIEHVREIQNEIYEHVIEPERLVQEFGEAIGPAAAYRDSGFRFDEALARADRILELAREREQSGTDEHFVALHHGNGVADEHTGSHGDEEHDGDALDRFFAHLQAYAFDPRSPRRPFYGWNEMPTSYQQRRWRTLQAARLDMLTLETIVKSTASEAITATSLDAVVQAVRRRPPASPIRVCSEAIDAGQPRYFQWTGDRFEEQEDASNDTGLGFHLMGPSRGLIERLHDKLPVGALMWLRAADPLASDTVTPSNRLSYVMRFHLGPQRILVSGDAGFTDFRPSGRKPFHPALMALLDRIDVVQIAHHGGLNHRFYQALYAARQHLQAEPSYLLLSHATHDKSRPQPQFSHYVSLFQPGISQVLFTAQPQAAKITPVVKAAAAPVVPSSAQAPQGDVRLSYDPSPDARGWNVRKHAVRI